MVRKRDEAAPRPPITCRGCRGVEPDSSAMPARPSTRSLRPRARRQPAPVGRLRGGREDRPRRRHDGRGGRAPDRDAALSEHRARAFQPVHRGTGPLRPAAHLRRPRDLACPRALVQRPGQCVPHRGINGGRHVAPLFAGNTVFAWSEVLAKAELPGAATSARCACARLPPRTGRAATFR